MNCPFSVFHFAVLCMCRAEGDSEQFTGGEEELCPSDSWTAETDRRADFTGELLSTFNGVLGLTIEVLVLDLNILICVMFVMHWRNDEISQKPSQISWTMNHHNAGNKLRSVVLKHTIITDSATRVYKVFKSSGMQLKTNNNPKTPLTFC